MGREARFPPRNYTGNKYASGNKWNYQKLTKLDRKSSRGMIYENEELRLRTININAEVERGQSDIRKLRRENEQLRREIWSLRDEYDRLDKLLRTNQNSDSYENAGYNSGSQSEDTDSCDTCKEDELDGEIEDEYIENDSQTKTVTKVKCKSQLKEFNSNKEIVENYENSQKTLEDSDKHEIIKNGGSTSATTQSASNKLRENLHVNFDHLSIVSEENLTNSDGNSVHLGEMDSNGLGTSNYSPLADNHFKHRVKDTNFSFDHLGHPLNDMQSMIPPLSHFENIDYDEIGPSLEEINYSTSTTTTGETIVPANGWDFNIQSAFSSNKLGNPLSKQMMPSSSSEIIGKSHPNSGLTERKSPKHFFSPIKPKLRTDKIQSPPLTTKAPDVFVANALPSPLTQPQRQLQPLLQSTSSNEPLYATIQKSSSRTCSPNSFQTGGNLEDLLLDIETLSKDILQMQLQKQKSYSQEKLAGSDLSLSNKKPYRSEMNLVLTYNGTNPIITPIAKATSTSSASGLGFSNNTSGISNTESQPTSLPEPMILFPQNLAYLGFEGFNAPISTVDTVTGLQQLPQTSQSQANDPYGIINQFTDEYSVHVPTPTLCDIPPASFGSPEPIRRSPAVLRRKLFTKRLDESQTDSTDCMSADARPITKDKVSRTESSASENANCDSSSGSEATKRKSRRVSITFNPKKSDDKDKDKNKDKDKDKDRDRDKDKDRDKDRDRGMGGDREREKDIERDRRTEENTLTNKLGNSEIGKNYTDAQGLHGSNQNLKTSNSQTNSPHSGARRNNSVHHQNAHTHSHHSHHHNRKYSQESVRNQRASMTSTTPSQRKCSRRHSEGTVLSPVPVPNPSNPIRVETNNTRSPLAINRDSFHEAGTSISERNSNSLASSRESSTSLSMRSQRRKISVSSHSGGKIPWCGCWGNGCL